MRLLHPLICDMVKQHYICKNHLLCHAIVCHFLVIDTGGEELEKKTLYDIPRRWIKNTILRVLYFLNNP